MLTHEVMGVFALGVLWLNAVLVALAALARARDLLVMRAVMKPIDPARPDGYGVLSGRLEALAPQVTPGVAGAPLAELLVEQVGRYAAGSKRAILWHDRSHASTIRASKLAVGDQTFEVDAASELQARVWLDAATVAAAAACEGRAAFEATFPAARKAKGAARTVCIPIVAGTTVWLVADARREDRGIVLGATTAAPIVVSTFDPRAWLGRRATWLILFAPIALALCAGCTATALRPPVFDGTVSKLGGLASFIYFLLVLPAGTRMRDLTALPHTRGLRGRWDGPAAVAATPNEIPKS